MRLNFVQHDATHTKTKIFTVFNAEHLNLGEVRFKPQWRRYVFMPAPNMVFDFECLQEVQKFLDSETKSWRQNLSVEKDLLTIEDVHQYYREENLKNKRTPKTMFVTEEQRRHLLNLARLLPLDSSVWNKKIDDDFALFNMVITTVERTSRV